MSYVYVGSFESSSFSELCPKSVSLSSMTIAKALGILKNGDFLINKQIKSKTDSQWTELFFANFSFLNRLIIL